MPIGYFHFLSKPFSGTLENYKVNAADNQLYCTK